MIKNEEYDLKYNIVRSKRKTLSLMIRKDCTLEVKAPLKISEKTIEQFVESKQKWVEKAIEKQSHAIVIPEFSDADFKKIRAKTLEIVSEFLSTYPGKKPDNIVIRKQKSAWGTCNSKGKITINVFVSILPRHLFEYIMIHELAHLEHLNHSQAFWENVSSFLPDWKQRKLHLRRYVL